MAFSLQVIDLLLGVEILGHALIGQLFEFDFLVDFEIFKLGLYQALLAVDLLILALKLVNLLLGLFDLINDGVLTLMRLM